LPESLKDLFSSDKLGHTIAYGALTLSYYWGFHKSKDSIPQKWIAYIALGTAGYGILMEIVQYTFFPNRYFEVLDILANIMGIIISIVIYKLFFNKTTAP
jgi:VanZ family protein